MSLLSGGLGFTLEIDMENLRSSFVFALIVCRDSGETIGITSDDRSVVEREFDCIDKRIRIGDAYLAGRAKWSIEYPFDDDCPKVQVSLSTDDGESISLTEVCLWDEDHRPEVIRPERIEELKGDLLRDLMQWTDVTALRIRVYSYTHNVYKESTYGSPAC